MIELFGVWWARTSEFPFPNDKSRELEFDSLEQLPHATGFRVRFPTLSTLSSLSDALTGDPCLISLFSC